jgi:hypothetical protein
MLIKQLNKLNESRREWRGSSWMSIQSAPVAHGGRGPYHNLVNAWQRRTIAAAESSPHPYSALVDRFIPHRDTYDASDSLWNISAFNHGFIT